MFGRNKKKQTNPFEALAHRELALRSPSERLAVHVRGTFDGLRTPLICIPGYFRNMLDFAKFADLHQSLTEADWPIVLVDLRGRGRSSNRRKLDEYSALTDAEDIVQVINWLGIERAVMLGLGHGAQVTMAFAVSHKKKLAGAILINGGPAHDILGLVRMRDNFARLSEARGRREFAALSQAIWHRAHPGLSESELDVLAARTHQLEGRRVKPLFDMALLNRLQDISLDDELEPQWNLFAALSGVPLLLGRSELTDRVSRTVFERMCELRPEAAQLFIAGQGSPVLLDSVDDVQLISEFTRQCSLHAKLQPVVSG